MLQFNNNFFWCRIYLLFRYKGYALKTELLAPAKDKETAIDAINCGADAVYIGASAFGARKNAGNSLDDIQEIVEYAHKYWVKIFVTVNTILSDSELDEAVELIKKLDKIGVDAVLIQDMGLLNKLIELQLQIPIHASTQCDNREPEKIKFFNDIGLSRVVLARELSLNQMSKIHTLCPNIELEAFVHGALCVSYSGQCYLSHYIGKRSANRGECAQPCRKKYTVVDDMNNVFNYPYPLCLKDLNAAKFLKEMIDAGIYSFKIEGRLKDREYVRNIVSYYRKELDKYSEKSSSGCSQIQFNPEPSKSFNRGFTNYFLKEREACFSPLTPKSMGKYIGDVVESKNNRICINTKEKISAQDGLCFLNEKSELVGFLVNKAEEKNNNVTILPNKSVRIKNGVKIYRNVDFEFEKELQKPVKRQIGVNVRVTQLPNGKIQIDLKDEDGVSVLTDILYNEQAKNPDKMNETFKKQFCKTGESEFYIMDFELNTNLPFIPVGEVNELRRKMFSALTEKRIIEYKREIQKPLKYCRYYKEEVDYRANVHNKSAQKFYEKCGVKVKEFSFEKRVPNRQVELMRTKHCIKYALNMCKSSKNLFLLDEKGTKYPLKFDCKNCEMAILSPQNKT